MARRRTARESKQPQTAEDVLRNVSEAAARIADSEDGKSLLRYLHEKVNARSTYVPGDSHATHLREGMRVLYLHIGYLIKLATSGQTKVYQLAEEPALWEQTRDVMNVREEISDGDSDN